MRQILQSRWILPVVVVLGFAARMAAATLGSNYDMHSWFIVADITSHGGNVYQETERYNYGPVWFLIVHVLDVMAGHRHEVLRYLISAVLSLADLGIFLFLCRQAGRLAGVLFFLNPVSILITGYHCQIDNVAILVALWSVRLLGDDFESPVNRRKFCGLLMLGLSLVVKHLFFVFPFWLAIKQKGFGQKVVILTVPVACFLMGFGPYWVSGHQGIINNVFGYHSAPTNLFYHALVPQLIQDFWGSGVVWYGLLVVFAFLCRTRNSFESLLIYTGVLVAFSPATSNQYLAIPCALASVFWSVPFGLYTLVTTYHLCSDGNGPHLLKYGIYADVAIDVLCFALAWLFWRKQFFELYQAARREVLLQLGRVE